MSRDAPGWCCAGQRTPAESAIDGLRRAIISAAVSLVANSPWPRQLLLRDSLAPRQRGAIPDCWPRSAVGLRRAVSIHARRRAPPGELAGRRPDHAPVRAGAGPSSNAPGYPLYTMGGWLWFQLGRGLLGPSHNPIQLLSGYSTLWALVALALLYALLLVIAGGPTPAGWPSRPSSRLLRPDLLLLVLRGHDRAIHLIRRVDAGRVPAGVPLGRRANPPRPLPAGLAC